MGIFDSLTGSGQARAQKTVRGLQGQAFDRNLETLLSGNTSARNDYVDGRNEAIASLTGARDAAGTVLRGGGREAIGHFDRGLGAARDALGNARKAFATAGSAYDPLTDLARRFEPAVGSYTDAVGLNGAEGAARARQAFSNSLRSDFEREQGLEAINRARAARGAGTISGGNIDRDTQIYGHNLANSKTDAYLDRLLGLVDRATGLESAAAAGRAGAANNVGTVYSQEAAYLNAGGAGRAQIAADTADKIAALTSGTGARVAGLQESTADRLANLALARASGQIGLRQDYIDRFGNSLLAERDARDAASRKSLDYGLKAAKLTASLASGGFSGIPGLGGAAAAGAPTPLLPAAGLGGDPLVRGSLY